MSNVVKQNQALIALANAGSGSDHDNDHQYLTFLLAGEMYAIAILNIKEIIEYGQITSVPMMPSFIHGVINLRGRIVPVIKIGRAHV